MTYSIASYSKWHNVDAELEALPASGSLDAKNAWRTNTNWPREVVGIWANQDDTAQNTTTTLRCRTVGSNEILDLILPLNETVLIPVKEIIKAGTTARGLHLIGLA